MSTEAVDELRRSIAMLPPLSETDPAGETTDMWSQHRRALRRRISSQNPSTFLTWNPIVRSMTFGLKSWIRAEFLALRGSGQWTARWRGALRENRAGLPMPCYFSPFTSGTLIHHAYHVYRFEMATRKRIVDFAEITEFGGGYGSMARLVARLGFRGRYRIHDLPEFSSLQRFYLRSVCVELGDGEAADVLSRITFPASQQEASPSGGEEGALFLATWSFGETPIRLREEWRPTLDRFSSFLFGFHDRFERIDNATWFEELVSSRPDVEWILEPILHRPGFYLFGLPARARGAEPHGPG